MKSTVLFITLLFSAQAFAQQDLVGTLSNAIGGDEKSSGVALDCGLGSSSIAINYQSGNKKAIYNGLEIHATSYIPIYFGKAASFDGTFGGRFVTAHNTANTSTASEHVEQVAVNLGMRVKFYRLSLGLENQFNRSQHYWVGLNTDQTAFTFNILSSYLSLDFNLTDSLKLSVKYSKGKGSLPSSITNLGSSSAYSDSVIGVSLTYVSGEDFLGFINKVLQ